MPRSIEPFYLELGRRISDVRRRSGLTQEALGRQLDPGLTRAAIANIETGKQRVLVKALVELALALGVAPSDLLPGHAPQAPLADLEPELAAALRIPEAEARALAVRIAKRPTRFG